MMGHLQPLGYGTSRRKIPWGKEIFSSLKKCLILGSYDLKIFC